MSESLLRCVLAGGGNSYQQKIVWVKSGWVIRLRPFTINESISPTRSHPLSSTHLFFTFSFFLLVKYQLSLPAPSHPESTSMRRYPLSLKKSNLLGSFQCHWGKLNDPQQSWIGYRPQGGRCLVKWKDLSWAFRYGRGCFCSRKHLTQFYWTILLSTWWHYQRGITCMRGCT